jgi:hypothetical protein
MFAVSEWDVIHGIEAGEGVKTFNQKPKMLDILTIIEGRAGIGGRQPRGLFQFKLSARCRLLALTKRIFSRCELAGKSSIGEETSGLTETLILPLFYDA